MVTFISEFVLYVTELPDQFLVACLLRPGQVSFIFFKDVDNCTRQLWLYVTYLNVFILFIYFFIQMDSTVHSRVSW